MSVSSSFFSEVCITFFFFFGLSVSVLFMVIDGWSLALLVGVRCWDWQERWGWVLMSAAVQMDFVLEACPKHQSLYPIRVLLSVGKEASGNFLSLECWVINQLSGFGLPGWGRNGSYHPLGYRLWLLAIKSPPFWLYFLDLGSPAEPGDLQLWVFAEWLLPCESWLPGSLWYLLGTHLELSLWGIMRLWSPLPAFHQQKFAKIYDIFLFLSWLDICGSFTF